MGNIKKTLHIWKMDLEYYLKIIGGPGGKRKKKKRIPRRKIINKLKEIFPRKIFKKKNL